MPKPYDSTSKFLIEAFPADWLALAGLDPRGPVEAIDANLSTVTAEADKVIRVGGDDPWLAHFEMQASRDAQLPSRLFRYNALIDDRHDLPTRSVAILLRPEADGPELTGEHRRAVPGAAEHLAFRYDVIRVWLEPAAAFLDGGLGILPLAPVSDLGGMPLAAVVEAVGRQIDQGPPELAGLLWTSTGLLMGLRHSREVVSALMQGVRSMRESVFYQMILEEGEARGEARGEAIGVVRGQARGITQGALDEARRLLIRLGERRFGPASPEVRSAIEQVASLDRLEAMVDRAIDSAATTWDEFWAEAGPAGGR